MVSKSKKIAKSGDEQPSFIATTPIGEDLLEGKAQENIAQRIADLIESGNTENRLFGLDGAWGSGKSNLIRILQSELSESHHFFVFDAWGHQEDLQRRSFLEELTADLCENKIIDPREWERKLIVLLSRKKETMTRTIPRLGYGVIVTVLIAIAMPMFQTFAEMAEGEGWKFFLATLPLFVGVCFYLIASCRKGKPLSLTELYAIYKDDQLTQEVHETVFEEEPSVAQFRGWMRDLSSALKNKKLVIVFDNMDRLRPQKVRELWSSIHTFFAEDSFSGIWTIVPFDRTHVKAAFDDDENVSEEFLRKSFSVIFRVAPPVLTDWQKFFDLKLSEAFPDCEHKEKQLIKRTFDRLQPEITPRSVITFINEMVSLRLTTHREISLTYLAVFVLTRKVILKDPVKHILSHEYLGAAATFFEKDGNLADNISALVYNVPVDSASQVTLIRAIQNAFAQQDVGTIMSLAEHRHFVEMLERVTSADDVSVDGAAATLTQLLEDKPDAVPAERMRDIWDDLCTTELNGVVTEQRFKTTHKLLLLNTSRGNQLALVKFLVNGFAGIGEKEFDGGNYYQALCDLRDCIEQNDLPIDSLSEVRPLQVEPEVYSDYLRAALSEHKDFKVKCGETELVQHLLDRIPNNLVDMSHFSTVANKFDFAPIVEHLETESQSGNLTIENIGSFYEFYKAISGDKKPIKMPPSNVVAGLLPGAIDRSSTQYELLAMRFAYGQSFPSMGGISDSILSLTDEEMVDQITQRIEFYRSYGPLLLAHPSWPQPIMKAVLTKLTVKPHDQSRLNIVEVLKNYSVLQESLDIDPEEFLNRLNGWDEHARERITAENIRDYLADHLLFEHAVRVDCDLTAYLIQTVANWLESFSIEQWQEVLRSQDSNEFKVTRVLLETGKLDALPDNAVTVFRRLLVEYSRGDFSMQPDADWKTIYEKTPKAGLIAAAKNIRDLFLTNTEITPDKFMFLSDLLLNHAALEERSAGVARRILAPVVHNQECLEFIVSNGERFAQIIKQAGDDAVDLKDLIRQELIQSSASEELKHFAGLANIGPSPVNTTQPEPDGTPTP